LLSYFEEDAQRREDGARVCDGLAANDSSKRKPQRRTTPRTAQSREGSYLPLFFPALNHESTATALAALQKRSSGIYLAEYASAKIVAKGRIVAF
jgi:hypothetical protein